MLEHHRIGSVHVLRLCHGKVSALDLELLQALTAALEEFRAGDARALVLTGTGGAFCGGADLQRLLDGDAAYIDAFVRHLDTTFRTLLSLDKPVVAAINGHAIAGGCILAAACDRRLMADGRGRIGVTELFVGVPYPPLALELLAASYDPAVLRTLVYEGALHLPEAALAMGVVDRLHAPGELFDAAVALAQRLGDIVPEAFALAKTQLNRRILARVDDELGDLVARTQAAWHSDQAREVMRGFFARATGKA
jgi:enoyl-CoA hydratase